MVKIQWRSIPWVCAALGHNWTCAANQGIPVTPKQIGDGIDGYYDYVKMYCKDCDKVHDFNYR